MMATLGANIRAERARRRLTAEELATAAGVTSQTILTTERDETIPTVRTLNKIAAALGVPASSLMSDDAAPGSTVSAANHDRPSTIHENQHDQHRREDARGDSDVSPSLGSEENAARTRQGAKGHSAA